MELRLYNLFSQAGGAAAGGGGDAAQRELWARKLEEIMAQVTEFG